MTEDEWEEDDDNDIIGEYLIEDADDNITLTMFPKVEYDFEVEFGTYYKMLKKCKSKEQMKVVLSGIISHSNSFAVLAHEIKYLQDRAKDLEFSILVLQQSN